jgi:hypothetical protein
LPELKLFIIILLYVTVFVNRVGWDYAVGGVFQRWKRAWAWLELQLNGQDRLGEGRRVLLPAVR